MAKRQAVEALDRTMQDITGVRLPLGGKKNIRAQIVDSSLRMTPIWSSIKKLRLKMISEST